MPELEYILGYDAREMFLPPETLWDAARRDQYLLRPELPKPLSVDCAVWPYFFDPVKTANPFEWRIGCRDLWDNPDALKIFVESEDGHPDHPCALIAVTLMVLAYADAEAWCQAHGLLLRDLGARQLKTPRPWTRLGYDVADGAMISGLTNCGWLPEVENVWESRLRWAPRLNAHHLFDRVEDARQFREFAIQRTADHAPFFVYGIYSLNTAS